MRLGIVGSHVLKRACDFLDRRVVKVGLYAPRISFASFSERCPSVTTEVVTTSGLEPFARSVVVRDINKSIFSEIDAANPDVVLVDFLDDHADYFFHRETESVITRSSYLACCDFDRFRNNGWDIVERASDAGWDLWLKGCTRFLEAVPAGAKIVLVKVFQPEQFIEDGEIKKYSKNTLERIRQRNAIINRSCEVFEQISGCQSIEFPIDYFVSETPEIRGVNPYDLSEKVFSRIANDIANLMLNCCEVMRPIQERVEAPFSIFGPLLQSGDVPTITELHKIGNRLLGQGEVVKAGWCEKLITILRNSSVPLSVQMENVAFGYGGIAVVIHGNCKIGDNVKIGQNVTLGGGKKTIDSAGGTREVPYIERRVYIAAGAKVIGGITIGEHSVIGANAVVTNDVPPFSVVAGTPGKVIHQITPSNATRYLSYLYKGMPMEDAMRLMFGTRN